MKLIELIKKHRKGFSLILALIFVENVAWIIEPVLFGNLIDAFINKATNKSEPLKFFHLLPLIFWITAYLINSSSGTIRRRIEPRIFQKIYVEMVTKISEFGKRKNIESSKTTARAQLSQEYITFMQYRIPEVVEQTIAIVGAIFALTFFDYRIFIVCLFISLPLLILSNLYSKNVFHLQTELHDNQEAAFALFETKETEKIKSIYSKNGKIQEKIAKWGALNFGVMRFVLLIIFLFVLYIAIDLDDFSTGDIYSIVSYLWTFITSVEYIPELLESKTSLSELSTRLKADN